MDSDNMNEHTPLLATRQSADLQTDTGNQNDPKDFDDVLEIVGSVGKYQKFLLYGILFPLSIFEPMFTLNVWFLLDEPDHWCHVPGQENRNISLDLWKNLTIPRTENGQFSKCTMYNIPSPTQVVDPTNLPVVNCTSGWDYDFSVAEYRSILVDYDWVCDKADWPTLVHTVRYTGRAIGTLILGYIADKWGRKPAFIISLVLVSVVRAISLYFVYDVYIFGALTFIIGFSHPMYLICMITIAVELSGKEYRAWIYSSTAMIIVVGLCAVPGIAYVTHTWFVFGWVTVAIGSLGYLLIPFIPESPRWLVSQGRVEEVVKTLQNIAKWNGTSDKIDSEQLRTMLQGLKDEDKEQKRQSAWKLFSTKRMATLTLLIIFTWVMETLVFCVLDFNSFYMPGNRYLNLILQAVMEIPGGYLGGFLSDKLGRRWTQVLFFLVSGVFCGVGGYFSLFGSTGFAIVMMIVAMNIAKITVTGSELVCNLQSTEIFPTPLRATGTGVASMMSSVAVIIVPYVVFLGKTSPVTPWAFTAAASFVGMIAAAFIPETLNYNLPKTLSDSEQIGKDKKFWSTRRQSLQTFH